MNSPAWVPLVVSDRDPVARAEGVVDLVGQITECAAQRAQHRVGALRPGQGPGGASWSNVVRGDELAAPVIAAVPSE